MKTFSTFGDLGDMLYLCPSMKLVAKQTGAPVILNAVNGLRLHDPITERLFLIRKLLETQDYIEEVNSGEEGDKVDYDCIHFRRAGHPFGITLATLQAQWLGLAPELNKPWLKVTPDPWAPIVINRSARYNNVFFPWQELVKVFGDDMLFIGLEQEHRAFCREFSSVEYLPTETLLEAAQAIAASELFIGNQSSCYAIAEGLKHTSIQETDLSTPDCIYPRFNAIHCHNGELDFSACGKHFTSRNRMFVYAHHNDTPPGGWRIKIGEHEANSYALNLTLEEIASKLRAAGMEVPRNLKEIIIEQNSTAHLDHPVAKLKAQLSTT